MSKDGDVLKIFFQGREELLRVIETNEPIIKYLSNVDNPVCPLLGTNIRFVKELGKGKMGIVFEIVFPDRGQKRYVAKKAQVPIQSFVIFAAPPPGFSPISFEELQQRYQISANVIITYNDLKAKPTDLVTQDVIIPMFKKGCILRRNLKVPKTSGTGDVTFQPQDKVCETAYTEFMISLLVGELCRTGKSINFLDTFYFATCIQGDKLRNVQQYTFMEKIDRSLQNTLECITEINFDGEENPNYRPDAVESITIQILHAVCEYQERYQIVHGDLHLDNIFLEYVTEDTLWKGENVLDADYYLYTVRDVELFVPGGRECPFIVKIGDWGIACKYSTPRIIEDTVAYTGYDQYDGGGPWLPNFYSAAYDPAFVIDLLHILNPSNEFIANILAWMVNIPPESSSIEEALETNFNETTERPRLNVLETSLSHVSALAVLTNKELMSKYMRSPEPGSRTILFGEV